MRSLNDFILDNPLRDMEKEEEFEEVNDYEEEWYDEFEEESEDCGKSVDDEFLYNPNCKSLFNSFNSFEIKPVTYSYVSNDLFEVYFTGIPNLNPEVLSPFIDNFRYDKETCGFTIRPTEELYPILMKYFMEKGNMYNSNGFVRKEDMCCGNIECRIFDRTGKVIQEVTFCNTIISDIQEDMFSYSNPCEPHEIKVNFHYDWCTRNNVI